MPHTGNFEKDIDLLAQNAARMFAYDGDAKMVSILSYAEISAHYFTTDNWNGGTDVYNVHLDIPQPIYLEIKEELENISEKISEKLSSFAHKYDRMWVGKITFSPILTESKTWKEDARDWLAGAGVTNQGRVRSNNIANRECDGLLFRSKPEIYLYQALKRLGVAFAPLPVFLKGGTSYSRIEPDFIIIHNGIFMCVEVDGDTVHRETPAEANSRTRILSNEGAIVERYRASECDSPEKAVKLAEEILALLQKHKKNRP